MTPPKKIDLIIPVYKNAALTQTCIHSVLENLQEIAFLSPRLMVINDSPDDPDVHSMLNKMKIAHPDLHITTNTANIGFVQSVNIGLSISKKDRRDVILINADTQTFPGTLSSLADVAYSDPLIGFVSPRSNNASLCSLPHFFGGALPSPEEACHRWKEISATLPKFHFTPTATGFYLFIKHDILANIGLLQEDFGLGYEEENDLILRANKVGYRAALANHAFAFHVGSASFNLVDLELQTHRDGNLKDMCARHPEFLLLVQRYEASPHFKAERLLTGLLKTADGRIKLAVDLSEMGCHYNGTNEFAIAVAGALIKRQSHLFKVSLICSGDAFRFHGLDTRFGPDLREDPKNPGKHAIAIRFGQPFSLDHIHFASGLAPVVIFAMLDTIAEDCGHLSIDYRLSDYWQYVARHASGILFISQYGETSFYTRYPDALARPKYTHLLSTRLSDYKNPENGSETRHILVLGNHFPHKASDETAQTLSRAFPTLQFVVLGSETFEKGNLRGFYAGTLDSATVARLFSEAAIVVLPSFIEGFGFGLMHALAARKVIVARNIPATSEILQTFKNVEGVFLYDNNMEIQSAILSAMKHTASRVDDSEAMGWDEWGDGLSGFCNQLLAAPDLFSQLRDRIAAGDLLDRASQINQVKEAADLETLLQYDDAQFVECAYWTLLKRPPDPDGLKIHVAQLRDGIPKLQILLGLQYSEEGKRSGTKLKGLFAAFIRYKFSRLPVIGNIFGFRE